MTTKRILVAYDGSEMSKRAVAEANLQAVEAPQREIHLLAVVTPTGPATNAAVSKSLGREMADRFQSEMEELKQEFKSHNIDVITEVVVSPVKENAAVQIVAYANKHDMDLIIIGSRGLGNMKKMLLGSVSSKVVQQASCPVLVMK